MPFDTDGLMQQRRQRFVKRIFSCCLELVGSGARITADDPSCLRTFKLPMNGRLRSREIVREFAEGPSSLWLKQEQPE